MQFIRWFRVRFANPLVIRYMIRRSDKSFTLTQLKNEAKKLFLSVNQAIAAPNASALKTLTTPLIYHRLRNTIDLVKKENVKRVWKVEKLKPVLIGMTIIDIEPSRFVQAFFQFQCFQGIEIHENGKRIGGSEELQHTTELWVLEKDVKLVGSPWVLCSDQMKPLTSHPD